MLKGTSRTARVRGSYEDSSLTTLCCQFNVVSGRVAKFSLRIKLREL
jgi:hypothetical protein